MIKERDVSEPKRTRRRSPKAVRAIPTDARSLGSILSESLPAMGEKTACTRGWDTRTMPAFCGLIPFMY